MAGKVYAFGCSMVWGAELFCPNEDRFSKLVADHYEIEEENYGKSGASNYYIQRKVLELIDEFTPEDKVIIMWTDPNRLETKFLDPALIGSNGAAAHSVAYTIAWNMFMDHLNDQHISWIRGIQIQYSTYEILKSRNINFMMMHWRDIHWELPYKEIMYVIPPGELKQDRLQFEVMEEFKSKMVDRMYTEEFFEEYALKHNQPIGKYRHPVEETHEDWSNIIIEWFNE